VPQLLPFPDRTYNDLRDIGLAKVHRPSAKRIQLRSSRQRFAAADSGPGGGTVTRACCRAMPSENRLLALGRCVSRWADVPSPARYRANRCRFVRKGEELGHYELVAYVVMANHVHLLIWPRIAPDRLLKSLRVPLPGRPTGCSDGRGSHFGRRNLTITGYESERARENSNLHRDQSREGWIRPEPIL